MRKWMGAMKYVVSQGLVIDGAKGSSSWDEVDFATEYHHRLQRPLAVQMDRLNPWARSMTVSTKYLVVATDYR